jgi:hypothetical protein
VELQEKMPAFETLGIRVLALSYDEPDALKDFQDAYGITYTLLSDTDSRVIRDYGILNTLIAEDDHPWFGIPFPGTYVTDSKGDITHKFFENNLVLRVGPEELLRAVDGEALVEYAGNPIAQNEDAAEVQPRVFLEGQQLAVGVLRHLVCQIEVPEGRHLYADPAPEGMVSFTMTLDAQSKLVARELIRPQSEAHTVTGTGEVIRVHHGRVELRLPITANAALTSTTESSMLDLKGEVSWQTCDDEVCDVPRRIQFEFSVPLEGPVMNDFTTKSGNPRVREMNGMKHFQKMSFRRQS